MKSLRKIINITYGFLLLYSCKGKSISISPIGADSIPNIARERKGYVDTLRSAISHNIKDADFEILIKHGDKVVYRFGDTIILKMMLLCLMENVLIAV